MSLIGGLLASTLGGLLLVAGVRRLPTAVSLARSEATPVGDVAATGGRVEFGGVETVVTELDPRRGSTAPVLP